MKKTKQTMYVLIPVGQSLRELTDFPRFGKSSGLSHECLIDVDFCQHEIAVPMEVLNDIPKFHSKQK
jgi:hypothetical protein